MDWDQEFQKLIEQLDKRGVMPDRVPSLGPTEAGLKKIGFYESQLYKNILQNPKRCLVIAGTNGKGSVSATLERLIRATGASVAMYTSPNLIDATERIRVNESNISKRDFVLHHNDLIKKTEGLELSHFEFLTLLAVHYFMERLPDYMIWEVGMGGVWDATNAIPHGTAVITRIGMDHERFLGRNLADITANKLGIVRRFEGLSQSMNVIHLPLPTESAEVFKKTQTTTPARWVEAVAKDYFVTPGPVWNLQINGQLYPLALMGKRAVENSSLALKVFESLGFESHKYLSELQRVQWPGRMEKLEYRGRSLFLSGDHNPQGMDSLLEILQHFDYQNLKVLMGMGLEKDLAGALAKLQNLPRTKLYFTVSPFQGRGLADFKPYLQPDTWFEPAPLAALNRLVQEAQPTDLLLVTGSLYLVGEIRRVILNGILSN